MISLGDPHIRLELMHLLSVVVEDFVLHARAAPRREKPVSIISEVHYEAIFFGEHTRRYSRDTRIDAQRRYLSNVDVNMRLAP